MKQGRCSLLSKTNRKVYQKFIRNSSNIAQAWSKELCKWFFSSKRYYSVQRKHCSYLSFSSKNRYCLRWCYWQCPAWRQILLCLWDCGWASQPRKPSIGCNIILRNKPQHTIHFLLSSNILPRWKYFIQKKISTQVVDVWWEHSTNECDCTFDVQRNV